MSEPRPMDSGGLPITQEQYDAMLVAAGRLAEKLIAAESRIAQARAEALEEAATIADGMMAWNPPSSVAAAIRAAIKE